jgi:hypothetical protein
MAAVTKYHVLVYGGEDGHQTNRAQIALYGVKGVVAYIRFNDPGMAFEADYEQNGIIRMHLPSSMFDGVLNVLQNEKPVHVYFVSDKAFFGTASTEPVGEEES